MHRAGGETEDQRRGGGGGEDTVEASSCQGDHLLSPSQLKVQVEMIGILGCCVDLLLFTPWSVLDLFSCKYLKELSDWYVQYADQLERLRATNRYEKNGKKFHLWSIQGRAENWGQDICGGSISTGGTRNRVGKVSQGRMFFVIFQLYSPLLDLMKHITMYFSSGLQSCVTSTQRVLRMWKTFLGCVQFYFNWSRPTMAQWQQGQPNSVKT